MLFLIMDIQNVLLDLLIDLFSYTFYATTMASKKTRNKPYDLNNPANWTAAQLRSELAQLGLNLTGSVPKTVLKQIYEQMINKTTADNQAEPVAQLDQNEDISSQTMLNRDNMETNLLTVTSDSASRQTNTLIDSVTSGNVTPESSNNDINALLVRNTLGMMTSMQTAISTLQSTVNTLITKQSVTGLETKNNLDKFTMLYQ